MSHLLMLTSLASKHMGTKHKIHVHVQIQTLRKIVFDWFLVHLTTEQINNG